MITIEKEFSAKNTYQLARLGNPDKLLFFDIETTGFSGDTDTVYLIGCTYLSGGTWRLIQWFADSIAAESDVLTAFFRFAEKYTTLVHFNGDTFDIPFLKKRCQNLSLPYSFDRLESIDIYKQIRPWKKHLGLTSLKQKAIEAFLGISREDLYNGGQLIEVYFDYLESKDEYLRSLLLLHNEDDLKGMPSLLPILFYNDFFSQRFSLAELIKTTGKVPHITLVLAGCEETVLPVPLQASLPSWSVHAVGNRLELTARLYDGTLKYYYPNYKDYYYLLFEDKAIHKSVGEYVDKTARVKATKETCYTKKQGLFLAQPTPVWTPEFKNSCRDKACFFEFTPNCFSDSEKLNEYVRQVMKAVFAGK